MPILDIPFNPNDVPGIFPAYEIEAHDDGDAVSIVRGALSPFATASAGYIAAGMHVLAIRPGTKVPGAHAFGHWGNAVGWQEYRKKPAPPETIARWNAAPHAGIGVALGTPIGDQHILIGIDFDAADPEILAILMAACPTSGSVKVGKNGETRLCRGTLDIESRGYRTSDGVQLLDILGRGKQSLMPPTIHPDTKQPYRWTAGPVPLDELPIFDAASLATLEAALRSVGWSDEGNRAAINATGAQMPSQAHGERDAAGDYFRETNNIAIDNFDMWVGSLGLPKLKRHGNGSWRGVAFWRDSGKGLPTNERDPNLSFHSEGITDFGDNDRGYTAIDVVVAALGMTASDAADWLAERLGLAVDDSMFDHEAIIANGLARAAAKARGLSTPSRQLVEQDDGSLVDTETGEIVGATNDNSPCHDGLDEVPEHLLHPTGLLGEVVDFIVATARSPSRTLALAAAIVLLGALAGRRDGGPTYSGTSVYALGIASSGVGKQHPQSMIQSLAIAVGAGHLVGTSDFKSGTAVVTQLGRKPLAFCCMDEFGSYLSRVNNKKASPSENEVSAMLRKMWTLPFEGYMTPEFAKTESRLIHSPSLSILGMSTPQQFYNSLTGADVENGLLNRFLVLPTSKIPDPVKPTLSKFELPEDLVGKLWDLFAARGRDTSPPPPPQRGGRDEASNDEDAPGAQVVIPAEVPWGEGAEEIFHAFHKESLDIVRRQSELGEFVMRRAEMALRLATIVAVGRDLDDPKVSIDDMVWGRDLVQFSSDRMIRDVQAYVGDTETSARWAKVEAILRKHGGKVAYSDLTRALKFSPRDMKDTLETMKAGEKIDIYNVERKGGTPGRKKQMILLLK